MQQAGILSADELRKRLYHKFKHNGIFDNLRSQLRKKLVSELDANKTPKNTKTSAVIIQVLNWLVGEHLKTHEYNSTLSVFAAEIGTLNRTEEMFTLHDILQLLNVNPNYHDLIISKTGDSEASILFHLLQVLGLENRKREIQNQSTQTESETISVASSLRIKLQQVEDFYILKKSASRMEFEGDVESQLMKYEKLLREKLKKESKDDLDAFKDREVLMIRMEEREKCREELKLKVEQFEKEHREKMDELVKREIEARRHMNTIKEALERDSLHQRQEILSQLDSARHQELEARRMADRMRLDLDVEKSKLDAMSEKMKIRENVLHEKENSIAESVRQLVSKERFEEREELLERTKQLGQRELEVENQRIEMELEREEARKLHLQSAEKISRVMQLEEEIERVQETNRALERENKSLSINAARLEENESVAADVETLKIQLRNATTERDSLSLQIVSFNSQLALPNAETWSLKRQLQAERDNRRLDRGLWDEQRRRFDAKLDAALNNNKSLASKIDEVVSANSQLHLVVENLRAELRHSRLKFHDISTNFAHGDTFYDTSLDIARLAPELQLQLSSWTPPDARLAALEKETEYLHRRIQHIHVPATWERARRSYEEKKCDDNYFVADESMSEKLNSTMVDEANGRRELELDIPDEAGNLICEDEKSNDADVSEQLEILEKASAEIGAEIEIESKESEKGNDVNLDSLWEQRETNGVNNDDISGANDSHQDLLDDW